MLSLSMCNELLAADGLSLREQARAMAALGYRGLELAPGTLADEPHRLSPASWRETRRIVEDQGLTITGLHWLLAPYPDLSILEPARASATRSVLLALIDGCAEAGGGVLVHGSPSSRVVPEGMSAETALDQAAAFFAPVAQAAAQAGITYCIEPLSPAETAFLNTVAEAQALVDRVAVPAFKTMIDTSAAGLAEAEPVAALIRRWVPTGTIGHIQVNDTNRGGPGMGDDPFLDIVAALRATGWTKPVAVEPFRTVVSGVATAAVAAATLRTAWEASA